MAEQEKRLPAPGEFVDATPSGKFSPEDHKSSLVIDYGFDGMTVDDGTYERGFEEVRTGGNSDIFLAEKKRDDRVAGGANPKGKFQQYQTGAMTSSRDVLARIARTGAQSTSATIEESSSQIGDVSLGLLPVQKIGEKSLRSVLINGGVGSDPYKGIPFVEHDRRILIHPNGEHIKVPRDYDRATDAMRWVPQPTYKVLIGKEAVETGLTSNNETPVVTGWRPYSTSATGESKAVSALKALNIPDDDSSYVARAMKITLQDGKDPIVTFVDERELTVTPSHSQYPLMNDVARQLRNRTMNLMEAINATTSDTRLLSPNPNETAPYCAFNTSDHTAKWKIRNIHKVIQQLNETGIAVFLAYHTAKVALSKKLDDLNREGFAHKTSISDWGLSSILGANSSAQLNDRVPNSTPDDMFDSVWASLGYAAWTVLLNESDKKFTDTFGKTGILANPRGFIFQFVNPETGAMQRLSEIQVSEDLLEEVLHQLYFTRGGTDQMEGVHLMCTSEISLAYTTKLSSHFKTSEPKVAPSGNALYFDPATVSDFTAFPWLNSQNTLKIKVIHHPLWRGIRRYLENESQDWFTHLQKQERRHDFVESAKGYALQSSNVEGKCTKIDMLIPMYFSNTDMTSFSALIARALPEILDEISEINSFVLPQSSHMKGANVTFNGSWLQPRQAESITDDVGKKELHKWITFYEAMKKQPIHYAYAEQTDHVMMGVVTPGALDKSVASMIKFQLPEMISGVARLKATSTSGLNKTHFFDVIEMPLFSPTVDYIMRDMSEAESQDAYGDKSFAADFPNLTAVYSKPIDESYWLTGPIKSHLEESSTVHSLLQIPARNIFFRDRLIEPWLDSEDTYIGAVMSLSQSGADDGRLLIAGVGLADKFTLEWWLSKPYSHGTVRQLPTSMIFDDISNSCHTAEYLQPIATSKLKNDGGVVYREVTVVGSSPFSKSILGRSGEKIRVWKKEFSAPDKSKQSFSDRYNYSVADSHLQLMRGFWEAYECNPAFEKVLGFDRLEGYSMPWIKGLVTSENAMWADSTSRLRQALPLGQTHGGKSDEYVRGDNGMSVAINPLATSESGTVTDIGSLADLSCSEYVDQLILMDPFKIWYKASMQQKFNVAKNKGEEYVPENDPMYHLYAHGLGGWERIDGSAYKQAKMNAILKAGYQYTHRITSEEVEHEIGTVSRSLTADTVDQTEDNSK